MSMSLLIKNWQMADWKELLKWAKIGLNNAMMGEFSEVEEIPPHGRLIDANALEKDIDKYIGGEESRSRFHHWVQVQRTVIPESEDACT